MNAAPDYSKMSAYNLSFAYEDAVRDLCRARAAHRAATHHVSLLLAVKVAQSRIADIRRIAEGSA